MPGTLSIQHAIMLGRLLLAPIVIVPVPLLILILNVTERYCPEFLVASLFISIVLILVLVLFSWKALMAYWLKWAFTKTANVHELQQAAKIAGLINSYIDLDNLQPKYTEIYNAVKMRLDGPVQYSDDKAVPYETVVYFRKVYQQLSFYFVFAFFMACAYMISAKQYEWGIMLTLVTAVIGLALYLRTSSRGAQIILNEEGIDSLGTFTKWKDISNEEVVRSGNKNVYYHLTYECPEGKREIATKDLYISQIKLNHLLFVYRGRYQKGTKGFS